MITETAARLINCNRNFLFRLVIRRSLPVEKSWDICKGKLHKSLLYNYYVTFVIQADPRIRQSYVPRPTAVA